MQSYDELQELIDTQTGDLGKLKDSIGKIAGATHHVIGELPKVGQIIKINGLKFRVNQVSDKGKIGLRILTSEN